MKRKKLKLKKKSIAILVIAVLLILVSWFAVHQWQVYQYRKTAEYKLLEKGYTLEELNLIKEKINQDYWDNLVEQAKDEDLLGIIQQKYFIKENLDRYRTYIKNNTKYSIEDVIAIVNVNADADWYEMEKAADIAEGYQMIVNKVYKLNEEYAPDDIVQIRSLYAYEGHSIKKEVLDAYINLFNAAKDAGFTFIVNSSYRTYEEQKSVYDNIYDALGRVKADAVAARPGHSEHQTGMALDIVIHGVPTAEFSKHDGYQWLVNNAHKYGFILRYPEGKEYITGFTFESWHYRYLGVDLATKVYEEEITYDEYYAYYLAK